MESNNIFFDINKLKFIGKNVIIGKTVRILKPELVSIDDNTIIDDYTDISGEVSIGKYVHIGHSCSLQSGSSKITIKDFAGISAGSRIYASSSDFLTCSLDFPTIPDHIKYGGVSDEVIIEAFSLIGANSVILPGCIVPMGFAVATHSRITEFLNMIEWSYYDSNRNGLIRREGKELILSIATSLTGIDYEELGDLE
jgi:acetyltransferase-like isoleucine patch superfamily enzyme